MERAGHRGDFLERLRRRRERHLGRSRFYRVPFAVVGFTVLTVGLAMLVLPGPGLLVMAVGLGMLALEFTWAERVLERTLRRMDRTGEAVRRARPILKVLWTLAALAAVAGLVAAALYTDVPLVPI